MPIIHFLRFGIKRLKSQHLLNHYETILFCMERTSCTFDPPENPTMQFTTYMIIICLTPGAPLGACPPGPLDAPSSPPPLHDTNQANNPTNNLAEPTSKLQERSHLALDHLALGNAAGFVGMLFPLLFGLGHGSPLDWASVSYTRICMLLT